MKVIIKKIINFGNTKLQYYILSGLNLIIPKSKDMVFIFDKRYRKDNVWAIKEYLSSNEEYNKYEIYYYTKTDIKSERNVRIISSGAKALWYQLRSKYVFYSYTDIKKIKPTKKQIVLDTMHGSPLKNIGYLAGNSRFKRLWKFEKNFTHILCISNFFKDIIKKSFGASEEQCITLGYPRNDFIFSNKNVLKTLGIKKEQFKRIILWMPTWRGLNKTGNNRESNIDFPILTEDNIFGMNEFLKENNILILIKPHPIQLELNLFNLKNSNIKIINDQDLDKNNIFLYEIFSQVDALLTDYSSVYFDFLLTMKPIGFTIDDFDSYGDKRGFVVDNPLEIMPGEKITTIEELIEFLNDIKEGNDRFYDERKKINNLANKYQDGNSTKRIIEYLGM